MQLQAKNAIRQAEVFHSAVKVDGVIMTKYDSASKGGMIITVSKEFALPTVFLGTGERYENLETFDIEHYLEDFIGEEMA